MVVPFGTAFPPTRQPRFGGAFLGACPSEIKPLTERGTNSINQSNCRLLIVGGRHLLRIIFVLLQLNLAWRRMRCYGELSRGAACSRLPSKSFSSTRERRGWPTGGDEIGPPAPTVRVFQKFVWGCDTPGRNAIYWSFAPPGRRSVNTEPLPGSLVTVTSPPIMRASLRVMASPRPVPPKRCAVVASAWLNSSNSLACCS